MIKMTILIESYVRIEKASSGLTIADGEAGRGIYFSLSRYPSMIDYYRRCSEQYRVIKAIPKSNTKILDLSSAEIHSKLIAFMRNEIEGLSIRMPGYVKPKIHGRNYQRFGRIIQDFVNKFYPGTDAYIVNHQADGTDLPEGKQMVIVDESAFDYKEL